ncbi:fibronectin type III-like domain-contianing protein [Streptomyces spinosirectus]
MPWRDGNPSGKPPMTFPKSPADLPTRSAEQYPGVRVDGSGIRRVNYTEGLAVGYKWYRSQNIAPLYAFGYDLSYTSFSYEVTNTGGRAGTETGQVYPALPRSAGEPGSRLAAFDRVSLRPGQHKHIKVSVARDCAEIRRSVRHPRGRIHGGPRAARARRRPWAVGRTCGAGGR